MKLTPKRAETIWSVIKKYRLIQDRVRELDKKGFILERCSLAARRSPTVGKIHMYTHSARLQVGTPYGYMKYGWVVMFDPITLEQYHKINKTDAKK